jgi:hypothetical protein
MITAQSMRGDYARIKKSFKNVGKGNVRLTQSSLILIQDINPTKSVYTFPVLENDNSTTNYPEQIKLNQNDEFTISQIGVYLIGRIQAPVVDPPGAFYPGLIYLSHSPDNASDTANSAQGLYDGYLKISINNIVYMDKYDVRKHEKWQHTEFNTQDITQINSATFASIQMDQDGVSPLAPTIQLSGAKKCELQLIMPNAINPYAFSITGNDSNTNVIVVDRIAIVCRGLLGQNSANFQGVKK